MIMMTNKNIFQLFFRRPWETVSMGGNNDKKNTCCAAVRASTNQNAEQNMVTAGALMCLERNKRHSHRKWTNIGTCKG